MNKYKHSSSPFPFIVTVLFWQHLATQAGLTILVIPAIILTCPVVTCQPPGPASLTGQVAVLDQETVLVNWTVFHQDQQVLGLEIVYSPVRARYTG